MELIVTIIGFGNVGKIIGALLLPYKDYRFTINIIDTDPNVFGAILDLEHGKQLYENHRVSHNSKELLNTSDFIFHCAGGSVPLGGNRLAVCQSSIEITEAIFKNFKPTKKPFIIVVANPVEIITFMTQKITGLPKENVIGTGTFLDSIRMNYVVKKTDLGITSVDAILLGEHGTTAFLSEQLSTVNGLPFNSLFNNDTLEELMMQVKTSAQEIKKTQKATIYGVSYCAMQIFESLLSEHVKKIPVSTFIPFNMSQIIGATDISISLLCEISSKGAHPIASYHPNSYEAKCLEKSISQMKACIPKRYT